MKRLTYLVSKLVELKISPTNECVEWPFAHGRYGHGSVGYNGKSLLVHRIAYEVYYGKPIENLICHKCDNPSCFNPRHLYDGTYKQNMKDVVDRNRMPTGEDVWNSRLTEEEVIKIIHMLDQGKTVRSIAEQFPVTRQTIWLIKQGDLWSYLPRPWGNVPPGGKLTIDQVKEILDLLAGGTSQKELASRFRVSQSYISQIKSGRILKYRHLL